MTETRQRRARKTSELRGWALAASLGTTAACAQSVITVSEEPSGAGGGGGTIETDGASSSAVVASSSSGAAMVEPQSCPEGAFALGFDGEGTIVCGAIDEGVVAAVHANCSLYFGWRDSCNNCMEGPSKWGRVDGESCTDGAGADGSCVALDENGTPLHLYGVNTDGDVNGDDKFYVGLRCKELGESALPGPCEPGEVAVSWAPSGYHTCYPIARLVARYVAESCTAYLGWRDNCEGCGEPPAKWGRAQMMSCANGAGDDGTCATPLLGGQWVTTFGVNTDGGVDGNDTFYAGLHCATREDAEVDALGGCPVGTALTAIESDASLKCRSLAPAVASIVRSSCALHFGWRDSCDGCGDPPAKRGWATTEACQLIEGADSGCVAAELGGTSVQLIALNTDGNVNGDDKFYAGFRCTTPP